MQKARRHGLNPLRPLVGARFQVLFHSVIHGTFHLSLTVLVRYRSLSSIQPYRMGPADSDRITRVPPYSGYCQIIKTFRVRDYHPLWSTFPEWFHYILTSHIAVLQPQHCRNNTGLGYSPFARHYQGNHFYFLFLQVLRCFSSLRLLLINQVTGLQPAGLPHSEIYGYNEYLPLTVAYRSLSRPSSPLRAKASAMRP